MIYDSIKKVDKELYDSMKLELDRQTGNIELIASENYVSEAVMAALGSHLTNKYAEGFPGKRYYGGCEYVDVTENIARDRMKELFQAEHANVQPHSGSQANMAVYMSVLKPGDKVLGMNLSDGGHLTHGSPVNFSGKLYQFVSYGVNDEGFIDYDVVAGMAKKEQPKMIVAGASAYSRVIDFAKFREIADSVGAYLMVDMAHIAGLIATGAHPSPVPYADFVSTTTHKTLRGPRGGAILCRQDFAKILDKAVFPGMQGGPLMHAIAAKAVCFKEAMTDEFKTYIDRVVANAHTLAEELSARGFKVVSGGTDNHLMLVDLRSKGITGKEAEKLLDTIGITLNKNTVPMETESPFVTSGVRIGTAATTTRGFGATEMKEIAEIIDYAIANRESDLSATEKRVREICSRFPLYE